MAEGFTRRSLQKYKEDTERELQELKKQISRMRKEHTRSSSVNGNEEWSIGHSTSDHDDHEVLTEEDRCMEARIEVSEIDNRRQAYGEWGLRELEIERNKRGGCIDGSRKSSGEMRLQETEMGRNERIEGDMEARIEEFEIANRRKTNEELRLQEMEMERSEKLLNELRKDEDRHRVDERKNDKMFETRLSMSMIKDQKGKGFQGIESELERMNIEDDMFLTTDGVILDKEIMDKITEDEKRMTIGKMDKYDEIKDRKNVVDRRLRDIIDGNMRMRIEERKRDEEFVEKMKRDEREKTGSNETDRYIRLKMEDFEMEEEMDLQKKRRYEIQRREGELEKEMELLRKEREKIRKEKEHLEKLRLIEMKEAQRQKFEIRRNVELQLRKEMEEEYKERETEMQLRLKREEILMRKDIEEEFRKREIQSQLRREMEQEIMRKEIEDEFRRRETEDHIRREMEQTLMRKELEEELQRKNIESRLRREMEQSQREKEVEQAMLKREARKYMEIEKDRFTERDNDGYYNSKTHMLKPKLPQFDGNLFEEWKYEINSLIKTAHIKDCVLSQCVRNSITGKARKVLLTLKPTASTKEIVHKMEDIYGNIRSGDAIAHEFYAAKQEPDESCSEWAVRLETLFNQAEEKGELDERKKDIKIKERFWRGLKNERIKNATRSTLDSKETFEILRKRARIEELEAQSEEITSRGNTYYCHPIQTDHSDVKFDELLTRIVSLETELKEIKGRESQHSYRGRVQYRGNSNRGFDKSRSSNYQPNRDNEDSNTAHRDDPLNRK